MATTEATRDHGSTRRRRLRAAAVGVVTAGALTGCLHTERVSVTGDGAQANGASRISSISTDGRYVTFTSDATNLYDGDTNGTQDLFIRDNVTGDVELAAIRADGRPATEHGAAGMLSDDGRYVTYTTTEQATDDDTDSLGDTFVHDRTAGTTVLASRPPDGIADDRAWGGIASANGRFVVVHAGAGGTWLYDVAADTTELITTGTVFTATVPVSTTAVSNDGTIVALVSPDQLLPEDTDTNYDVYVYDLAAGTIDKLDPTMFLVRGYLRQGYPMFNIDMTPDGRYIAYSYQLYNNPGTTDAYVYDRATDTAEKLPELPEPEPWWSANEFAPTISDDGRYVAYNQLVLSEMQAHLPRLVVHDRDLGSTTVIEDLLIFRGTTIRISGDGRYVTFGVDTAEDPGDTNGVEDVFVRYAHQPQPSVAAPIELSAGTHEVVIDGREIHGRPTATITGGGVTVDDVTVDGSDLRLTVTVSPSATPGPRGILVANDGSWPGRPLIGGTGLCNGCLVVAT